MLRGFLDTAQVMPVFVYLGVLVLAFGIRYPPTVLATVVYAVPPAVRLTNHGLRGVPVVMNEVGESFGSTSWQQLTKVQLPIARRTILLGLNQVIMMAFGIVVIGSLLGTGDTGAEVLKGLQKNDVGTAAAAGLAGGLARGARMLSNQKGAGIPVRRGSGALKSVAHEMQQVGKEIGQAGFRLGVGDVNMEVRKGRKEQRDSPLEVLLNGLTNRRSKRR